MAKIKINPLQSLVRRQPYLPDWYRFLSYFIFVIFLIFTVINLILPSKNNANENSKIILNNNISVNSDDNIKIYDNSNTNNDPTNISLPSKKKESLKSIDGTLIEVDLEVYNLLTSISKSIVNNDFSSVNVTGGNPPLYNLSSRAKVDDIYISKINSASINAVISINEDPSSNSLLRVNVPVTITLENNRWVFPSNLNSGV